MSRLWLAAVPGGWIADRILGYRRAVFLGGVIIAAGHFSMALGWVPTFYLGLVLIVIGTGLLKPNVSAIVGDLYPEGGARRDAGFSVFYMGINIGAFIAPIIAEVVQEKFGFNPAFAVAGVGMILCLTIFWGFRRHTAGSDRQRIEAAPATPVSEPDAAAALAPNTYSYCR